MPNDVQFYPLTRDEHAYANNRGPNPSHRKFVCGSCGKDTNGRVVADLTRACDGAKVAWCICTCRREEPTILVERGGVEVAQFPSACEFVAGQNWPPELEQLFDEAAKAFAANAFTASTMVCRKLLMATACREGATDGKPFVDYVAFITDSVLTFPKAKDAIDKIRSIGNEANHTLRFVGRDDAARALSIVTYMLNAIYSLPAA